MAVREKHSLYKEREEMARRAVRARHSRRGEHGDHNNNNNSGEIEQWENSVYFGKNTDQWEMHKSTLRHSLHGDEHEKKIWMSL
jgi:hypothetical protein